MLRLHNFSIVSVINFKMFLPNRQVGRNEQQLKSHILRRKTIKFAFNNNLLKIIIQNDLFFILFAVILSFFVAFIRKIWPDSSTLQSKY